MLLWVIFAVLTALAAAAILRPLWQQPAEGASAKDVEIYKQQLREIAEERASGLLGEAEAQAAEIEISRRLLAATERAAAPGANTAVSGKAVPYAVVGVLAVISAGMYMIYGSPDLPGQPHATRTAPQNQMQAVIERVERRLKERPEDGEGWSVIGTLYARDGRFAEAVAAHTKAMKILGETAERLVNIGEAMAFANNGQVSAEARGLFEKAIALNAGDTRGGFWLALADEQAGKFAEAAARYKQLLAADFPDDAKSVLRKRLAAIEQRLGIAPSAQTQPSQSGAQPSQGAAENEMINGMVNRLAERLQKDGSDLKGWLQLVRSYSVLGRKDDALKALGEARGKFAGNAEALSQIDALAQSLGLTS